MPPDVVFTMAKLRAPTAGALIFAMIRRQDAGLTADGYRIVFHEGVVGTWQII